METVVVHGVTVPLDPDFMPPRVLAQMKGGSYEGGELSLLKALLRPGDRVLDLGAGFGVTATFAATQDGVERVVSFEANPTLADHLAQVHALNGAAVDQRFGIVVPGPGGDTRDFFVRRGVIGSSLFANEERTGRVHAVPTHSFQDILDDLRPTLISCDIEGGEHELLVDARLDTVRALVIEMHPKILGRDKILEIQKSLERQGLRKNRALSRPQVWAFERASRRAGPLARLRGLAPRREG